MKINLEGIISRFSRKKAKPVREEIDIWRGVARSKRTSSYHSMQETYTIDEKEKIFRNRLNLRNSRIDKAITIVSLANTMLRTAFPLMILYDGMLAAYSYKTSAPNYIPNNLEDKIAKYMFPICSALAPIIYYTGVSLTKGYFGWSDNPYMIILGGLSLGKAAIDTSRRYNEKIVRINLDKIRIRNGKILDFKNIKHKKHGSAY